MNFFSPEDDVYLNISTNHRVLDQILLDHIWFGTLNCYLDILNKKWLCKAGDPLLAISFKHLAQ